MSLERSKRWEGELLKALIAYGDQLPPHVGRICSGVKVVVRYQQYWKSYKDLRSETVRIAQEILQNRECKFMTHVALSALDQVRAGMKDDGEKAKAAEDALVNELRNMDYF